MWISEADETEISPDSMTDINRDANILTQKILINLGHTFLRML